MVYGFCDLCINTSDDIKYLNELALKLYNAGYKTIVINQNVDESIFNNEKKKRKKGDKNDIVTSTVPEPLDIQNLKDEFKGKLNILNRITFSFSDPVKTHSLNQLPVLKKYNLYAVTPKTHSAFQFACTQLNADIISINSTCSGLKINRKLYLQAVEKGTHFEIQYSDVIKPATRKLAIHYSHLFFTFGKSKNVIISSGASHASFIRDPYDVINLARLLGLNETKAKLSILKQAHNLLLKGEGRRSGKALFTIECDKDIDSNEEDDSCEMKTKKIKV